MATNPYSYSSKGERWTVGEPTSKALLDKSRIKADANRWALEQLLVDPDDTANFDLSAYVDTTIGPDKVLTRVDYISSAIDAHKIVPFFLDEPAHVSPTFNWRKAIRQTSWYAELGAPPTHGAFVVNAAQTDVEWIDLDSATLAVYMTFTGAANNIVRVGGASEFVTDIEIFDFKLLIGNDGDYGLTLVDFLEDAAYLVNDTSNGGLHRYVEDISNRNSGTNSIASYDATLGIVTRTVNAVAICRDPSGAADHFGRPLHYWFVYTAGGGSLYSPIDNAIYDTTLTTNDGSIALDSSSGLLAFQRTGSPQVTNIEVYNGFEGISSDGWSGTFAYQNNGAGGADLPWANATDVAALQIINGISPIANGPVLIVGGTAEGILLLFPEFTNGTQNVDGGIISLTSTYVTPYMKGTRLAAYPLDSVTDRSGNGNTLTNNGTTAFTGTSPLGVACADFDGTDDYFYATFSAISFVNCSLSFYFKADDNNPAATQTLFEIADASRAERFLIALTTSGTLTIEVDDGVLAGELYVSSFGPDVCDLNWHHIAMLRDNSGYMSIYLDSILIYSNTSYSHMGVITVDRFGIGAVASGSNFFDGQIANLSFSYVASTSTGETLTGEEIALEYSRMVAGLAGNTTLLTADDIDSVQVAPDGEYAIVTAGDVAHIMDPRTGIILSTDAVSAGTLNDAAIWQRDGADTPAYLLGASTTVEAVQPDERIGG